MMRARRSGYACRAKAANCACVSQWSSTAFQLSSTYDCLGVRQTKYANNHEGEYRPLRPKEIAADTLLDLPLVCRTGRGGETVAISESGLEDYAAAYLVRRSDRKPGVELRLTPRVDDPRIAVDAPVPVHGLVTPWRTMMIVDRPEHMIGNSLVDDLALPSRIGPADWVEPGKAAWGWWSGQLAPSVADPGHNDETYKRYIDFAGRFGLRYMLIDHGWAWRGGASLDSATLADITRTADGVNLPELIAYARARGVRIWLWVNWRALEPRMDEALALYQRLGVAGVKADFLYRQDQEMVSFYHRLLRTAARHRLLVNIHAAFVPRGLARTYPNYVSQEGVLSLEYNRWSRRATAQHDVALAYTRAAIGPMDYTPGGFRNVTPADFRPRKTAPQVMTTRAHQLALFVTYPSPVTVLADAPAAYEDADRRPVPGAEFLKLVPTRWDETRGIAGEWNRWIVVARRSDATWYIGVINGTDARTVTIPLNFLGGGKWRVRAWTDGNTPSEVERRSGDVDADGRLGVSLKSTGGATLIFDRLAAR